MALNRAAFLTKASGVAIALFLALNAQIAQIILSNSLRRHNQPQLSDNSKARLLQILKTSRLTSLQ